MMLREKLFFSIIFFLSFFRLAAAHLVGGVGLESGLVHPLLGFDHLLAMVAVGVVATQVGKGGIFFVPLAFVSSMVFGGLLGIAGVGLPFVETWIAVSVLVLGAIISFSKKIPLQWAIACVALFGIFHGHAHGEELPMIAEPVLYVAGFVLSTTVLHVSGVLASQFAKKIAFNSLLLRVAGFLTSLAGIFFLLRA